MVQKNVAAGFFSNATYNLDVPDNFHFKVVSYDKYVRVKFVSYVQPNFTENFYIPNHEYFIDEIEKHIQSMLT